MATRTNTTTTNVVRLDGEGKTHGEGKKLTPLCNLKGNENHTWVSTPDAVDCVRCIKLSEKQSEARERLEYSADVRDTQDMDFSQGEPKNGTPVPRAEFTSEGVKPLPAVEPVKAENGETVTVPVDWDNPTAGRRELDASKGERILSEDDMSALLRKVRERLANEKPLNSDQWAEVVTQSVLDSHFAVTLHEPKNGDCPDVEIPPLPEGVHPHTWELAHQGNTEGARNYHMRQAKAQEKAYAELQEATEESRKAVELDTPPF